jgi:hypothetical protein
VVHSWTVRKLQHFSRAAEELWMYKEASRRTLTVVSMSGNLETCSMNAVWMDGRMGENLSAVNSIHICMN